MNAPEKCPKCGADDHSTFVSGVTEYACGTMVTLTDPFVHPSYQCLRNQRDQLAARVEELEDARTKAAANSLATMLAYEDAMRRIYELESESDVVMGKAMAWKAYAGRLEEVIESLEIRGDQMDEELYPPDRNCSCHISPPCSDCVDWTSQREAKTCWHDAKKAATKAKETKP